MRLVIINTQTSMDLHGYGLNGTLPPSLNQLLTLLEIYLSDNTLFGPIKCLAQLVNLILWTHTGVARKLDATEDVSLQ